VINLIGFGQNLASPKTCNLYDYALDLNKN